MWLASAAAALWIVAVFAGGSDFLATLGLAIILVGFATSAWGTRDARKALMPFGFLAVAVGIVLFYRADLWSSIYNIAGLLFAVGAALSAAGAWRGSVVVQRTGLLVAALASLIWVYADLGAWWWQPGNVLMAVACMIAAWGAGRE